MYGKMSGTLFGWMTNGVEYLAEPEEISHTGLNVDVFSQLSWLLENQCIPVPDLQPYSLAR